MESLHRFRRNRNVFEDFTVRTLAAIPTDFARLHYVSSLLDAATGQYVHEGLQQVYPASSVQEALEHCHQELFSRILETPLKDQAQDIHMCLERVEGRFGDQVENWRESRDYKGMCPQGVPGYLSQMFCSNMDAILEIFSTQQTH